MTRTGKIARLPRALREQINQRLQNSEPGEPLLAWLNPLPEVQTILKDQFAGLPISKQNLSDWRKGGFVEWEFKQEIAGDSAETIADAREFDPPSHACLSDYLATVITARYASLVRHWNGEVTDELQARLKVLHAMIQNISQVRRWDHSRAKLLIALAKQGDLSEETAADSEPPQNQAQSTEIPVAAPRQSAADSGQSSPVKVSQGSLTSEPLSPPSPTEPPLSPEAPAAVPEPLPAEVTHSSFSPLPSALPSLPSSPVKPSQGTLVEPKAASPEPIIVGKVTPIEPLTATETTQNLPMACPPHGVRGQAQRDPAFPVNTKPSSSASTPAKATPKPPKPRRTSYDVWSEHVARELDPYTLNSLPTVSRPAAEVTPKLFYDSCRGTFAILTDPDQPQYPDSLRWGKGLPPEKRPYRPTMCRGKCNLSNGFCTGCQRSEDEITLWPVLTRPERVAYIHTLLERRLAKGQIK